MSTKVFVGNLSFKTTEADLAAEFSSAGTVVSANIITRGPRSLGYGFVELENEDAAKKSVQLLNKKKIDDREINVELAKPRDETKIQEKKNEEGRGRGRGRGRGGRGRGGSTGRGRGGRGRGYRRGGFRPRGGEAGAASPTEGAEGQATRGGRQRGEKRPPKTTANQTPSKTTLFVANLPFSYGDEQLLALFKEFNATKAHVVKKRNTRSKGFGFVEFEKEEDQTKALAATDKKVVEERELIVKIALTENKEEGEAKPVAEAAAAEPAKTEEKKN